MKNSNFPQQQSETGKSHPDFSGEAFCGARIWQDGETLHIDVKGLDAPDPLYATISLIESPGVNGPVFFHHDRDPQLLYQELIERGWQAKLISRTDDDVLLELRMRQTDGPETGGAKE